MKKLLVALLKGYKKLISPYIVRSCRYTPSCSEYAIEAVEEFGAVKGTIMTVKRLSRCHPFSRGGYDPVAKR